MEGRELKRERYRCVSGQKGQMVSPLECVCVCVCHQITVEDLHVDYKT